MSIPTILSNDDNESIEVREELRSDTVNLAVRLLDDGAVFELKVGLPGQGADEVDVLIAGLQRAQGAVRRERGDYDRV